MSNSRFALVGDGRTQHKDQFLEDVSRGLASTPKVLPSLYFYDERGSQLFEEICDLDEYYLTRAETRILELYRDDILKVVTPDHRVVELGSGSSRKTELLLEAIIEQHGVAHYCPIDISAEILTETGRSLCERMPGLSVTAVADRYEAGLTKVHTFTADPCLLIWLGSSIGNLTRREAADFLGELRLSMEAHDHLLLGIDLRKDANILEAAYNDSRKVTAQFNLNLLERINRELNGEFDIQKFQHRADYLVDEGRIEMHLESLVEQSVGVSDVGQSFHFKQGETILTEYSYKYSLEEISTLAAASGLSSIDQWFDPDGRFSLTLFKPV